MLEYGKSNTFDIAPGADTTVSVTLANDLAELALPDEGVILAGSEYEVSVAARSEALRDAWHVRQEENEEELSAHWFLRDEGDPGFSGNGPITLVAPDKVGESDGVNSPYYTLWHHGQFFISDHLLTSDEAADWDKWTYGSNYAGLLNPWGTIIVELN